MTRVSTFKLLSLGTCLWLTACPEIETVDATEVIVVVDADEQLKTQLASLEVEVFNEAGKKLADKQDFALDRTLDALPISFGVYQPSGGDEWFMLKTRGFDERGERQIEYKVIGHFEKNKRTHLQVKLSSNCLHEFCDDRDDLTCSWKTGRCEVVTREGTDAGRPVDNDDSSDGGPQDPPGGMDASMNDGGPNGTDAGMSEVTTPVAPSSAGFSTLGGRRTDGTITVYDDGFELGPRVCTGDGRFCVTGSFSP